MRSVNEAWEILWWGSSLVERSRLARRISLISKVRRRVLQGGVDEVGEVVEGEVGEAVGSEDIEKDETNTQQRKIAYITMV